MPAPRSTSFSSASIGAFVVLCTRAKNCGLSPSIRVADARSSTKKSARVTNLALRFAARGSLAAAFADTRQLAEVDGASNFTLALPSASVAIAADQYAVGERTANGSGPAFFSLSDPRLPPELAP